MIGKSILKKNFRIAPVCFMTWVTLGYILPVQAAVVADITQGNIPGVLANGNGSITVNINAASANGISHNKFTQFDVTNQGLVLNNSKDATTNTLGGMVTGNSNITTENGASLIINEVTSNRTSQLNGKIEVAGTKADVIVANPAGITCDGCGFINTGRATLTTGKLNIINNQLSGINVSNGVITVTGKGMNDETSDYTALLARTVQINARLDAKDLQVMVGQNGNIIVENDQIKNTGSTGPNTTLTGLDVSALGGMYANKITLIANQGGVGVNNSGIISATTDLKINSNGFVYNSEKIDGESININTNQLTNTKIINSFGELNITTTNIINTKGLISTSGKSTLTVGGSFDNSQGTLLSSGDVIINSTSTNNNSGLISANNVSIVSNLITNNDSAAYISNENIPRFDDTGGGIIAKDNININGGDGISSVSGLMRTSGPEGNLSLSAINKIDLLNSKLAANDISISANDITAYTTTTTRVFVRDYKWAGRWYGHYENRISTESGADIDANGNLNINARNNYDNYAQLSAGKIMNINSSGNINNFTTMVSRGNLVIDTAKDFTNNSVLNSAGSIMLHARNITNQSGASIVSAVATNAYTDKLTNQGSINRPLNIKKYDEYSK